MHQCILPLENLLAIENQHRNTTSVNMADIVDTTAVFNTIGAEIRNVPAWARNYFDQQTKLMEKLLEETTTKKSPGKILFNCKSVVKWDIINVNVGGMGTKARKH